MIWTDDICMRGSSKEDISGLMFLNEVGQAEVKKKQQQRDLATRNVSFQAKLSMPGSRA
jgi:hypothetical protein